MKHVARLIRFHHTCQKGSGVRAMQYFMAAVWGIFLTSFLIHVFSAFERESFFPNSNIVILYMYVLVFFCMEGFLPNSAKGAKDGAYMDAPRLLSASGFTYEDFGRTVWLYFSGVGGMFILITCMLAGFSQAVFSRFPAGGALESGMAMVSSFGFSAIGCLLSAFSYGCWILWYLIRRKTVKKWVSSVSVLICMVPMLLCCFFSISALNGNGFWEKSLLFAGQWVMSWPGTAAYAVVVLAQILGGFGLLRLLRGKAWLRE